MRPFSLLSLCLLLLLVYGCKSIGDRGLQISSMPDKTIENYYEELSGNHKRLVELRTGLFAQYQEKDGKLLTNSISGDSVFLYSHQIGDPARYGYWVLHQQFLAGIPEEPLTMYLEHFKRIGRDSFISLRSNWPYEDRPSFLQLNDPDYHIEEVFGLDTVLNRDLSYVAETYRRQTHAHFTGWTDTMRVSHPDRVGTYDYKHLTTSYQPLRTIISVNFLSPAAEIQGNVKAIFIRKSAAEIAALKAIYGAHEEE